VAGTVPATESLPYVPWEWAPYSRVKHLSLNAKPAVTELPIPDWMLAILDVIFNHSMAACKHDKHSHENLKPRINKQKKLTSMGLHPKTSTVKKLKPYATIALTNRPMGTLPNKSVGKREWNCPTAVGS